MGEERVTREFTTSLVRWALLVRLVSVLVALLVPTQSVTDPRVAVALGLLGAWSLVWLGPRGRAISVVVRHPMVAVGDALVAVAVTALVGVDSPLVFATLSTALAIGVLFRPTVSVPVTGVLVAGYLLVALAQVTGQQAAFVFTFVLPATYVVLAALGGITRHLHRRVVAQQARLTVATAEAAAAAERARLAREMHDSVAKSLHGVALAAAALPRWVEKDPSVAVAQASAIQQAAEQASLEARDLLVSLRNKQEGPLVERLTDLVVRFRERTGLDTSLHVRNLVDLEPGVCHEILQVVDEALENVQRHAGARHVEVQLDSTGETVEVRVVDDGAGFEPTQVPRRRFGLLGMRERAGAIGGALVVDSAVGRGTRVALRVPLQRGAGSVA